MLFNAYKMERDQSKSLKKYIERIAMNKREREILKIEEPNE